MYSKGLLICLVVLLAAGASGELVGHYGLNRTSGAVVDSAGTQDGTVIGTVTRDIPAVFPTSDPKGFDFSGTDSGVDLGTAFQFTNAFTVTMWVNPDSFTNFTRFFAAVGVTGSIDQGYRLMTANEASTNNFRFLVKTTSGTASMINTNELEFGTWYFLAARFDPNATVNEAQATVIPYGQTANAALVASHTKDSGSTDYGPVDWSVGGALTKLATVFDGSRNWFDGRMDDVGLFDKALSDAKLATIYNNGVRALLGPTAYADWAETELNTPILIDVLTNDISPDESSLIVTETTSPEHGSVSVDEGGSGVTYTPTNGWMGADSFSYTVEDTTGLTHTAAVTVVTFLPEARQILSGSGVHGGMIVHLDDGGDLTEWAALTAGFRPHSRYTVQGLSTNALRVAQARNHIAAMDQYGFVSIDRFDGEHLPYTENLINLIVAEDLGTVSTSEVMRVLAPGGVAYLKDTGVWVSHLKTRPGNIDEWTHHLHAADSNPVAEDLVAGPPKGYQWLAEPMWARAHDYDSSLSGLVTAGGRIFYFMDEAPISLPGANGMPDRWYLAARDAFNGVPLWTVRVEHWGWQECGWRATWYKKRPGCFPINLHRRVVAIGDRVYTTLGYNAPVSQLDAATGIVLQTYPDTGDTREILYQNGLLILTLFDAGRVKLKVIHADTGAVEWETVVDYAGSNTEMITFDADMPEVDVDPVLNAASDGDAICLLDGLDIVCHDFTDGGFRWRTTVPCTKPSLWVGTLLIKDGVVLYANPDQLFAFSAETGSELWTAPKKDFGHLWFTWKDVFAIHGLAWTWSEDFEDTDGGNKTPISVKGYNLQTGDLNPTNDITVGNIFKVAHHHRCYRNKATPRFILASRRGTEFIDLVNGQHTVHNWARATCHYGMMPANGLQYLPPHPCQCYIKEKLNGFHVLAPERTSPPHESGNILEQGPAYGQIGAPGSGQPEDWGTARQDTQRSGAAATALPQTLIQHWTLNISGKLTPPTIAGRKLFVCSIDEHRVVAIDTGSGQKLWEFIAGGRVDSPPTYYKGSILFGCADGWVYCLRASDGELAWRFRAALEERRIGAFGQLESAWPVSGSILVQNDTAYLAAGRSSHLDDGITLYGLDPHTGAILCETNISGPELNIGNMEDNYSPPQGALADILRGNGQDVYMRHLVFDSQLVQKSVGVQGIQTKGGMLDNNYFQRADWYINSNGAKRGQLLVYDAQSIYLARMFASPKVLDPAYYFTPGAQGYELCAYDLGTTNARWSVYVPIRVRAMVVSDDVLAIAGPPDIVPPGDPYGAIENRMGGVLRLVSTSTGEPLAEYTLDSPPVFNGLSAAHGELHLCTIDGRVMTFGTKGLLEVGKKSGSHCFPDIEIFRLGMLAPRRRSH